MALVKPLIKAIGCAIAILQQEYSKGNASITVLCITNTSASTVCMYVCTFITSQLQKSKTSAKLEK